MAGAIRLSKVAKEFGVGVKTITDFLVENGIECDGRPTSKIDEDAYDLLLKEFSSDKQTKEKSRELSKNREKRVTISIEDQVREKPSRSDDLEEEVVIKNISVKPIIDLPKEEKEAPAPAPAPAPKAEEKPAPAPEPKSEPKAETPVTPAPEEPAAKTEPAPEEEDGDKGPKLVGKIDLDTLNLKTRPDKKAAEPKEKEEEKKPAAETKPAEEKKEKPKAPEQKEEPKSPAEGAKPEKIATVVEKLAGPKITGQKIDLSQFEKKKKKPVASSDDNKEIQQLKKKRKRITPEQGRGNPRQGGQRGPGGGNDRKKGGRGGKFRKDPQPEITQEDIQKEIKETLARLSGGGKSKASKHRKAKREAISQQQEELIKQQEAEQSILKITEFATANELATLMDANVNDVIAACMSLGLFVSINQRLDKETLQVVAEEFGYTLEFTSAEAEDDQLIEEDDEDRVDGRPPIVTVMGHVDHGKTSLLDYVRKANVIAGEAGGITQHIGAYSVKLENEKTITFLDTPGHEAFTAMRSRGAQVTDIAIIVIAADDNVMPQTKEAINHAQAAGVPIIFAINKVDKEGANPERIKEELAAMNLLVEDWGGKYQSEDISAKQGKGIEELLEKVLLEAELLELKADAGKRANGTVIEAALDKGKGYVSTMLVQSGTMRVGDVILAGAYTGKVKAMFNERGQQVSEAGPSRPVSILGLNGAPSAGDKFNVMPDEKEAKNIAQRRQQLLREQGVRTQKHITLDEIGRRIAIGDFQELNVIIKGDVDGSIEALSDSLQNLSTEKIQVNIIHKSVGQISESDVLLASASNAIIIGFQVRPSQNARTIAEKEMIDIRLYSIIYDAIEEVKQAMEGMLKPKVEERVVCNVEVRETFKISKVGTIAGCYVTDGTVTRNTKIRLIRDGIVVYTGNLGSLKRFKDDVKEVKKGFECGLNIENFNDVKVGDVIEGYEEVEVKQTLD